MKATLAANCLALACIAAGCQSPNIAAHLSLSPEGRFTPGPGGAVALDVKDSRRTRGRSREDGREVIAPLDETDAKGTVYLETPCRDSLASALETGFKAAGFEIRPDAPVVVQAEARTLELDAQQFTHWPLDPDTGYPWDPLRLALPGPVRATKAKLALTVAVRKDTKPISFHFIERSSPERKERGVEVIDAALSEVLTGAVQEAVGKASPMIALAAKLPVSDAELAAREAAITDKQRRIADLEKEVAQRLDSARDEQARLDGLRADLAREREGLLADRAAAAEERRKNVADLAQLRDERSRLAAQQLEAEEKGRLLAALEKKEAALTELSRSLDEKAGKIADKARDVEERDSNLSARLTELAGQKAHNQATTEALVAQKAAAERQNADLARWESELKERDRLLKEREAKADAAAAQAPFTVEPPPTLVAKERPSIVIEDPQGSDINTTLGQVTVKGIVLDNRDVKRVAGYRLDGEKKLELEKGDVSGDRPRGARSDERSWEPFAFRASLREGRNRLSIEATNGENLVETRELSIQKEANGRTYLVAIGINSYEDRDITPLRYAVDDAKGVVRALGRGLLLPLENVKALFDDSASKAVIELLLARELGTRVRKNDTVIFYFSGHGAPETDAGARDDKYLLPYDAMSSNLPLTALSVSAVAKALERLPSERTIFLADTCFSGREGGRSLSRGVAPAAASVAGLDERLRGKGRIVISASKGSEVAVEQEDLRHGVFTYFLIRGLEKDGDLNGDGRVTVSELYEYVSDRVSKATGGAQNPQWSRDDDIGDIVISRLKR